MYSLYHYINSVGKWKRMGEHPTMFDAIAQMNKECPPRSWKIAVFDQMLVDFSCSNERFQIVWTEKGN